MRGKRNRVRRADHRGVTFVEVIVSMLVLGISLIALLGGFMLALRINMKSRNSMSATIVAQNVAECVKEYARFYTVENGVDEEIKQFLPASYAGEGSFRGTATGFELASVHEGANEFKVIVTYDTSGYSSSDGSGSGINDQKLPDLSTLEDERTLVFCPPGVVDGSFRQAAENFYYEEWLADARASVPAGGGGEGGEGGEDGEDGGFVIVEPTEAEKAAARAKIQSSMTAKLTIEIKKLEPSENCRISMVLEYCYSDSDSDVYYQVCDWNDTFVPAGVKESGNPQFNLYVFYEPAHVEPGNIIKNDKIFVKNAGLNWNLFLAVQETDAAISGTSLLVGPEIRAAEGSGTGTVYVYSNAAPELVPGVISWKDMNAGGESGTRNSDLFMRESYERLANVSIAVYMDDQLMEQMEISVSQ